MSENLLSEDKNEDVKVPQKFLNKETGEINTKALLKSYLELEKKLSEKTSQLPKLPSSIEEYSIICNHDYFNPDNEINQKLLERGFTNEQAQLVYDLAEEKMIPMIVEIASHFQCDKEKEKLHQKFGGQDKWREVSRQLLQYGKTKLPEKVLEGLSSSYDGVMALYNMMTEEAPVISVAEEFEEGLTPEDLHRMMKDRKYWQTKDPEFVKKVTQGFKKLYK